MQELRRMQTSSGRLLLAAGVIFGLMTAQPAWAQGSRTKAAPRGKAAETADGPQTCTSKNFVVHTDLTKEEAEDLLVRLETMLVLISKYWGRPNSQLVEMYVVKDLKKWPPGSLDPRGLESIETGGGVTLGQTLENRATGEALAAKAVVYAVADHGTPQHEAVHAYCQLNFGRTGPVWYSEGMAEMGQYWKDKDSAVNCHEVVVKYLKSEEPKTLRELVSPNQTTGDSWQNYAWRWALCHLLANNTNYAPRFRPLGLALLANKRTSFEDVYGPMAEEISFEYLFFLEHFDRGYRADLCSWDWKTKFTAVRGNASAVCKIDANQGWQASRLLAKEGETYSYTATGEWKLGKDGEPQTAAGDSEGRGVLEGIYFEDYKLSEPFSLGDSGEFTATQDGKLFLRCKDAWHELGDNSGEMAVRIKKAK